MSHAPKRARTAGSGACSYCIGRGARCYIGVKGIPCSYCRRKGLACDSRATSATVPRANEKRPPFIFCSEELFASQIRQTERQQYLQESFIPAVPTTHPLDNYLSIFHQVLGPRHHDEPSPERSTDSVSGLLHRLDSKNLCYLDGEGALSFPSDEFRNQLLQSYMLWVHPQVPVLDLEVFLSSIAESDGSGVSLLLFQAVMFAGSAFVHIAYVHREGYPSRKVAREALFWRVKVLLDMEWEDDRLTTVKALILLMYWEDIPGNGINQGDWMHWCLSLAKSIGLHREPDENIMTLRERQIWRRTWWSLYNLMSVTAEGVMSAEEDCTNPAGSDMGMVKLSDFPFRLLPSQARAAVVDFDILYTIESQKSHAILFIEKTRLCRLSRISHVSKWVSNVVSGADTAGSNLFATTSSQLQEETGDLQQWLDRLPSAARSQYPFSLTLTERERSMCLHRMWLRVLHLGACYAACCGERAASNTTGGKMDEYLLQMADLFDEIDSLGLSEQLPCACTPLIALVLAYHWRLVETGTPDSQKSGARVIHRCWNVMQKLQESSDLATCMIALVREGQDTNVWERLSSAMISF